MELILVNESKVLYSSEDKNIVLHYKWRINHNGYCDTSIKGRKVLMHRLIMNCISNKIVDHINGNKLDNRRENLRITDAVGNSQNKRKNIIGTSNYLGVSLNRQSGKYVSYIVKISQFNFFKGKGISARRRILAIISFGNLYNLKNKNTVSETVHIGQYLEVADSNLGRIHIRT